MQQEVRFASEYSESHFLKTLWVSVQQLQTLKLRNSRKKNVPWNKTGFCMKRTGYWFAFSQAHRPCLHLLFLEQSFPCFSAKKFLILLPVCEISQNRLSSVAIDKSFLLKNCARIYIRFLFFAENHVFQLFPLFSRTRLALNDQGARCSSRFDVLSCVISLPDPSLMLPCSFWALCCFWRLRWRTILHFWAVNVLASECKSCPMQSVARFWFGRIHKFLPRKHFLLWSNKKDLLTPAVFAAITIFSVKWEWTLFCFE